jgi:hypothetical protein
LPGDSDCGQDARMMSKSQLRSRFSYWADVHDADSHGDAEALERGLVEQKDRSKFGSAFRNSTVSGSPVFMLTSLRSRIS